MFMVSIKFSVIVFVSFLSYTGSSDCDSDDDIKRAGVCGQKGLCITVNDEKSPVTTYNYSKNTNVTLECHYKDVEIILKNFTLRWKQDGDVKCYCKMCRNFKKIIYLSPDINGTTFTCERQDEWIADSFNYHGNNASIALRDISDQSNTDQDGENYEKHTTNIPSIPEETQVTPKESLITKAEDKDNGQSKSFLESNWIVLTAVVVIIIIVLFIVTCIVLKSKNIPKEDKRRLNPKGSRDDIQDVSKDQNTTYSEPKLDDFYTDPKSDTTSEEYCNPYMAMYSQPIPKQLRNGNEDKRRLNPKGSRDDIEDISKDKNTKHTEPELNVFYTDPKSDTTAEEYCSPYMATYTQPIPKRLRNPNIQHKPKPKPKPTSIENYSNACGLVYDEPTTNNNIAKNTGTMYHNINKNTGTYDNFNKSLKNIEQIHFIDNKAASYSNTKSDKYNSDVYSDPELYDLPY